MDKKALIPIRHILRSVVPILFFPLFDPIPSITLIPRRMNKNKGKSGQICQPPGTGHFSE